MRIKEAAEHCRLTEKAICLYQEKGLITSVVTVINGRRFRDYDEHTVGRLETIASLRRSFFSI
ncbi:MAG: MerR family transcriptional regulator [Clostridia bacterium]|nr:MerR family transcriptional regulator [Clostridia bacterium]